MPRNVAIFLDGTSNKFGRDFTNVLRLFDSSERNSAEQVTYYDPGVGTLPQPGLANPVKWAKWKLWNFADLAIGWGLEQNVEEAYRFLMNVWEPGDNVFLFGFSRGAYTARVLAGLLNTVGLLRRNTENLVPYLMSMYKSVGDTDQGNYWELTTRFRSLFCRPTGDRLFPIHFLGVWDTVSSYGYLFNPTFPHTAFNPSVKTVRHALSVDERRAFFRANHISLKQRGDVKEYWFPGAHADVGGGYPEADGGLWRPAFEWMLQEAINAGLKTNEDRLKRVRTRHAAPAKPYLEKSHQPLLKPCWWPFELYPRLHPITYIPRFNLFRSREIRDGAKLHQSTLLRLKESKYSPRNMSNGFKDKVHNLAAIEETYDYTK